MFNIPVIPTQFEVATLWESVYSKLEGKSIKTQNSRQAVACASFEYCRNTTSQLAFAGRGKCNARGGLTNLTLAYDESNDGLAQNPGVGFR